jgi:hypothetical protein
MYLRYIALALIGLIATLIAFIFADVIALFIRKDGTLPPVLRWFSTYDNPAIGDASWRSREVEYIGEPTCWWDRYRLARLWIRRNPAMWIDHVFGVTVEFPYEYSETGNTKATLSRDANRWVTGIEGTYTSRLTTGGKTYFDYCKVWQTSSAWYRIGFGWNLSPIEVGRTLNLKLVFNRW